MNLRREIAIVLLLILPGYAAFKVIAFPGPKLTVFAIGTAANEPPTESLTNGLEVAWLFQDGAGANLSPTSTVNGYTLTNHNTVWITNTGGPANLGWALIQSNSTEFLSYSPTDQFARTGAMTVLAWVKVIRTNDQRWLFAKSTNTGGGQSSGNIVIRTNMDFGFSHSLGGGMGFTAGAGTNITSANVMLSGEFVAAGGTNTWLFIGFTVDADGLARIYTNGSQRGTVSIPRPYNSMGDLRFGRSPGNSSQAYITMGLGPTYILRRELSGAEVNTYYTNGVAGIFDPRLMLP